MAKAAHRRRVCLLKLSQLTTKFDDAPGRPVPSSHIEYLPGGAIMETARPEGREIPGVRRLARELITEFGEQAPAMARTRARESLNAAEAQTWLRVLDAVESLSPGRKL